MLSWGMGRPSSSGKITGRDMGDCAGRSLAFIDYPHSWGVRCGGPGTMPGF